MIAPAIIHAEVAAGLRKMAWRKDIEAVAGRAALIEACRMPIATFGFAPFARRVWELRERVSPYDAWYVALAETSGGLLVTADARLARAASPVCQIELIRPPAP